METEQKRYAVMISMWCAVAILAGVVLTMAARSVFREMRTVSPSTGHEAGLEEDQQEDNTKAEAGKGYAIDTVYAGDTYVNRRVFLYPFRKTAKYIKNVDFLEMVGEEAAEKEVDNVKNGMEALLNFDKHKSADEIKEAMSSYFLNTIALTLNDDLEADGIESVSTMLADAISRNGLSMECTFKTDKCLLYHDEYSDIVRGQLTLNVIESDDLEKLGEVLKIKELKLGEPVSMIVECYLTPDLYMDDHDTFKIYAMSVIGR